LPARTRGSTGGRLVLVASALSLPETAPRVWSGPAAGQGSLTIAKARLVRLGHGKKARKVRRIVQTSIPIQATSASYDEASGVLDLTVIGSCGATSGTARLSSSQVQLSLCGINATWQVPAAITATKERSTPA
jgi:hypothetical protein